MIAFIEGTLVEKSPTRIVVQAGGVGYELFIPLASFDRLPNPGETTRLLTVDYVREDARILYGFSTEKEKRIFEIMLGVSGIGPKLALGALSGLSSRELTQAVVEGDVKRLSSISGIGRKTAERLVVELRDKFSDAEALEAVSGDEEAASDPRSRDAVLALISLGYKQADARKMLRGVQSRVPAGASVEDIVRLALTG